MTSATLDITTIKARQKATWESGDFGQVAKHNFFSHHYPIASPQFL